MNLIEVHNLEKTFVSGEVVTPVLRGLSFSISRGEFVSIMGPSGSGKSTLLHILGFLDRPTKGNYIFEGKSAVNYTDEEAAGIRSKKIGFIFQTFNLLPRTTVLENVLLPLIYSDLPEESWDNRARSAIDQVGLSHRVDYDQLKLSGGERQRVAAARALVNNPDIIFADEPTGNLDSKSGNQIMKIIESFHKRGRTIILITHETYTAKFAERIIHIKDGRIESDEQVKRRHSHEDLLK